MFKRTYNNYFVLTTHFKITKWKISGNSKKKH